MIAAVVPSAFVSEDVDAVASGIEGTALKWEVSTTNQLSVWVDTSSSSTVTSIPDYTDSQTRPWYTAYKDTATSISIGTGVTGVGNNAFNGMNAVTEVTFPSSIATIGDNAFAKCTALRTVTFVATSGNVTIGEYTFSNCSALNSINLNTATLTGLGSGAFYNCTSLDQITIPSGISALPADLFEGCSNLKNVYLPTGITTIGNHAFSGCTKISQINFGSVLATIYPSTFAGIKFMSSTGEVEQTVANLKGKTWMGSGDGKLYASGSTGEFTITFNAQGGVSSASTMATVGGKLPSLPTATYGTKHFDGWFMTSTGGSIISTSTVFTENKTVYALWDTAKSVTGVTLDKESATVNMGGSLKLNATVSPADATDPSVVWSSSDNTVATVDNSGNVTPVKTGTARITVTTNDGGKTATCDVTVQHVPIESVTLNKTTAILSVGDTVTLTPTVTPTTADVKTVTWESSATTIATVDQNGVVTAVAAGTATITVKTVVSEKTATCTITVATKRVTGLTMDATASMNTGGKLTLSAVIAPADADVKTINWSSSNTDIATVDSNGQITALKAGEVIITAETVDGGFTKTCTVTITDSVLSSTTIIIIVVIVVALIAIGAVFYLKKSGTLGGSGGFGGKKKNGGSGKTGVTPLRPINKP